MRPRKPPVSRRRESPRYTPPPVRSNRVLETIALEYRGNLFTAAIDGKVNAEEYLLLEKQGCQ